MVVVEVDVVVVVVGGFVVVVVVVVAGGRVVVVVGATGGTEAFDAEGGGTGNVHMAAAQSVGVVAITT